MNFYKRYMGDYARKTAMLSVCEHGAYTLLLDHYYSTRQPLPAELSKLCKLCRASDDHEREAVRSVANTFFPMSGDGLRHNKRADEEIARWDAQAEFNRAVGKLGGRPSKTRPVTEPVTEPQTGSGSEPKPIPEVRSQKLEVRNKKPEKKHISSLNGFDFEQFRSVYPKRAGTQSWQRAIKAAHARIIAGDDWPTIVTGAERYAAYCQATGKVGTEYVLQAATFLGPDRHYANDWTPPRNKTERLQDSNIAALREWMAKP